MPTRAGRRRRRREIVRLRDIQGSRSADGVAGQGQAVRAGHGQGGRVNRGGKGEAVGLLQKVGRSPLGKGPELHEITTYLSVEIKIIAPYRKITFNFKVRQGVIDPSKYYLISLICIK